MAEARGTQRRRVKLSPALALPISLLLAVFLFDVLVFQDMVLPSAPYALPILVATFLVPPPLVAAVALGAALLQALSMWLGESAGVEHLLYLAATALIGVLSFALAQRIERETALQRRVHGQNVALREQNEQLQSQNEKLQEQSEELRSQSELLGTQAAELVGLSNLLVAQRDRAEQAALEANQTASTLGALLNSMPDEVWACDAEGNITLLSAQALPGIGVSLAQGTPRPVVELAAQVEILRPDGTPRPVEEAPLLRSLLGERLVGEEIFRHVKTGELRNRQYTSAPIRNDKGAIVGAVAIVRDITIHKRSQVEREELIKAVAEKEASLQAEQRAAAERERLLREVEQLADTSRRRAADLRTVIESIVDAIFVCDAEGKVTMMNNAARALVGGEGQPAGRTMAGYARLLKLRFRDGRPMPPEDWAIMRALGEGRVVPRSEDLAIHPRTQQPLNLLVSAAPLCDKENRIVGAVTVVRDVTELVELDRLKDQFVAVAAHELKTPVAIMKGFAQAILRQRDGCTEQEKNALEAIDRGADRINNIVKDLLDISRLEVGDLALSRERVDVTGLVTEVVARKAASAPKHLLKLLPAAPVTILGDRQRIEQVLLDLIDNAIKYSPDGGEIEVGVEAQDGEAVVSVKDRGIGIPKEKQARIFERFYSAHTDTPHDFGGMAVGLYIANQIITRMGGRVWFESEAGKGSTFHFSLPLA